MINALRLAEGRRAHLGGNYYHVQYLASALAATDLVDLIILTDDGSHESLQSSVENTHLVRCNLPLGSIFEADQETIKACHHFSPDVYHRPTGQLPFGRIPCPAVATIADLNFKTLPMSFRQRMYKELSYRWTVRTADALTCISEFTKGEVVKWLGADPRKITVVHHGTNRLPAPDRRLADSIGGKFWMTFGHQPQKNVETCIEALMRRHSRSVAEKEKLVVVGQSEHIEQVLKPLVRQRNLTGEVVFVGRIDAESLSGLYDRAIGLLFLSRYEGFGLPVLEAMGAGCPAIVSNVCSLPEVAGTAAPIVHPDDYAALSMAMARIADDPAARGALVEAGLARASEFTWSRAAQETLDIYYDLLGRPRESAAPVPRRAAQYTVSNNLT